MAAVPAAGAALAAIGKKFLKMKIFQWEIGYNNGDGDEICTNTQLRGGISMAKWVCVVCGYIYDEEEGDPDNNIAPGTLFEELPEDFVCPLCGVGKEEFEEVKEQKHETAC